MAQNSKRMAACLLLFLCVACPVAAASFSEEDANGDPYSGEVLDSMVDYQEIQEIVNQSLDGQKDFDFQSIVKEILSQNGDFQLGDLMAELFERFREELFGEKGTLLRFLGIALTGAVFTNVSRVFDSRQAAETGFYVSYLLLFMLLTATFYQLTEQVSQVLHRVLDFMKALIPSYFMVMAFASGAATSTVFYEAALFLIALLEGMVRYIVLPLVQVFFLLSLADNLVEETMLSKLLDLLESAVRFLLRTVLGIAAGYHAIQALVMPAVDQLKQGAAMKVIQMVPGVGNAVGGVTETVLGAALVLKNALGLASVLVLLLILLFPMIKIGVMVFFYRFGAALVQPAADERVVEAMQGAYRAGSLLLRTLLCVGVLFLLSLTVTMSVKTLY